MAREFWIYQNTFGGDKFVCDFNQRGFIPERLAEAIHVREILPNEKSFTREEFRNICKVARANQIPGVQDFQDCIELELFGAGGESA